jgi:Type III restriction enzyme, res subunit
VGRRRKAALRSDRRLVLNRWLLGLFGVESFETLADEETKDPRHEERDANNVSGIYHLLAGRFHDLPRRTGGPSVDELLRYDENIVRHTDRISAKRDERVRWKYFQYLSLLFAEVFLDRFFRDPERLLGDLNTHVRSFNEGRDEADRVPEYAAEELRKLAFWMATGSGKTLIMHVNVLQYLHYLNLHDRRDELDRILLLTPNEGLSRQHLREFGDSELDAEIFSRSGQGRFTDDRIEILEVTKLADDSGATTIAVEAFEGNNLVLVDEGHRGMSSAKTVKETKKWKERRDRLCEGGFSFEYSATFGQAMKSAKDKTLADEYAKCILFDYSYRYFYGDGYGKDYQILNLQDGNDDDSVRRRYLTAALLSFHQQQLLFKEGGPRFAAYGIERPLWMFVGSRVTGGVAGDEKTDVAEILLFLSRFLDRRAESVENIARLLGGNTGLLDGSRDLFADEFGYLQERGLGEEELYDSIVRGFFNSAGGVPAKMRAEVLKGAEGEVSLRLGDNEPFGVVNVGKAQDSRSPWRTGRTSWSPRTASRRRSSTGSMGAGPRSTCSWGRGSSPRAGAVGGSAAWV